jgi:hypothetical protein
MAIEYSWDIISLNTTPSESGLTNVVKSIDWCFIATDGGVVGQTCEQTMLPTADTESFTAYDDLTEETIIGWIKQYRDYDDIFSMANQRLEEAKEPVIVERIPPWANTSNDGISDGETQNINYLVVIDDIVDDPQKIFGPLHWDCQAFNAGIIRRGINDGFVPDEITCYRKRLYPVNEPLVLSDRVKIYRVDFQDLSDYDAKYQFKDDNAIWVIENGRAIETHKITDKTVDEVKSAFRHLAKVARDINLSEKYNMTLNGETISTYINPNTLLMVSEKVNSMSDSDNVNWKLNDENWVNVNKSELNQIKDFIQSKQQEFYDEEYSYVSQLDACSTVEELKTLYNTTVENL